jgi:hypothetical protein
MTDQITDIEAANKTATAISRAEDRSPEAMAFALLQRKAAALAQSDIIPTSFRGNPSNCIIALNFADRLGAEPLAVMQSLHIIHGKPSWSSSFLIANINASKQFNRLRWETEDLGEKTVHVEGKPLKFRDRRAVCWTTDRETGERIEAECTVEMAVREGWYSKPGSKWPTMTDQMLKYRSASFFAKTYAPHISLGLSTADEETDIAPVQVSVTKISETRNTTPFVRKEPKWEPGEAQRSLGDIAPGDDAA